MDILAVAAEGSQPVPVEVREILVEPFIAAATTAFAEMAGTEACARTVIRKPRAPLLGDLGARLNLTGLEGFLVLACQNIVATAIAGRVLAGVEDSLREDLVLDCLGEVVNVIAGQAKALLAETPYRFAFSTPTALTAAQAIEDMPHRDCLVMVFGCDLGDFALQLYLR